jgi:hypothetical protein
VFGPDLTGLLARWNETIDAHRREVRHAILAETTSFR